MTEKSTVDYAIIGGGVSGLYTAWRIMNSKAGKGKTVRVYEASDRTGGRLLTWMPGGEGSGLRAELGGMRYFESQQVVTALIKELGLQDQSIKFFTDGPGLIWSFRGYRTAAGDTSTTSSRYRLRPGEDIHSFDLVNSLIDDVLEQNGIKQAPTTWEDWNKVKKKLRYQGKPLWEVGFWNLLYDLFSPEAYRYIVETFGYYTPTLNWNAAEAFQNISLDFTTNPNYKTLRNGYDQITKMLQKKIEDMRPMGPEVIKLNTSLFAFDLVDATIRLRFKDDSEVTAKNLVLALPRRSLELLAPTDTFNLLLDKQLQQRVQSVRPYPAFKLFLFYPNGRWWEKLGFGAEIKHGRSVTDMPIRQTYYLRPDNLETPDPELENPAGLIMASYDDSIAVDFWHGLELPPKEKAELDLRLPKMMAELFQAFTVGQVAEAVKPQNLKEMHVAPPIMIRHARQQLALLHGVPVREIPEPQSGAYADWSLDPYGGGWHFWEPQIDAPTMMPMVRQPLDGRPVYIVGEAYSGLQGWVEGALTTAEHVLQDELNMPKPPWLSKVTYFGP